MLKSNIPGLLNILAILLTSRHIIGYVMRYTYLNIDGMPTIYVDPRNEKRRLKSRKQGLIEAPELTYVATVQDSSESSRFSRLHLRDRPGISVSTPVSGREGEIWWGRLLCTC